MMSTSLGYSHLFKQPQPSQGKNSGVGQNAGKPSDQSQHNGNVQHPQSLENNPKFQAFRAKRNAEVMAHESAHAAAAGSFGGAIHIDYDGNGVATGGHVPIQMPSLDSSDPSKTVGHAQTVINAATAPGADMSGQDAAVAAQAQSILGQAQVLMAQKGQRPQKI